MKIYFSDGITVETAGPYRVLELDDGFYVVGHGIMTPCSDRADAEATRQKMMRDLFLARTADK